MNGATSGPGLPQLFGHDALLARIRESAGARRMPQSLLVHGATGAGKRSVGLWMAALLQCQRHPAPCGVCRSCHLASRLQHPDIHYHFPMPRPKRASSRKKLREAIEGQRLERLGQLREDPSAQLDEDVVTGIYLAAVENIRAQASKRPAMGPFAVFVVADVERMVPQSASPEAANAFLKLLEEPPEFAYLILTTDRPEGLLPTIRSRTAHLRVPPIPEEDVARFLMEHTGLEREAALRAARRSEGAIGRALRASDDQEDEARSRADRLLGAALRGDPTARYVAASEFSARGARSMLASTLERLEERLRDLLCHTAGAPDRALDPAVAARIDDRWPQSNDAVLTALRVVDEARESAHRNLNPQATVSVMLADMDAALNPRFRA